MFEEWKNLPEIKKGDVALSVKMFKEWKEQNPEKAKDRNGNGASNNTTSDTESLVTTTGQESTGEPANNSRGGEIKRKRRRPWAHLELITDPCKSDQSKTVAYAKDDNNEILLSIKYAEHHTALWAGTLTLTVTYL